MATEEVKLPQLGESVTEGIITAWLVEVGEQVETDQPLFELSTDKVDTEVPSPVSGVLKEQKAAVDDTVEVGQVIAVVDTDGDAGGEADDSGDETTDDGAEADGEENGEEDGDTAQDDDAEQADEPDESKDASGDESEDDSAEPDQADQAEAESKSATSDDGGSDGAEFDVVIVGGGTGGYSAALRAAQLGLSVALVEKDKVGGTCLHWGCIPTKALLQSAEVAEHAQEAGEFGVNLTYEGVEIARINEHKDDVVSKMYKGLQGALKGRGVETVHGTGTFVSPHEVEVELEDGGNRTLTTRNVVIATGSEPREMPFAPFDGKRVISSDEALHLDELPKRAIILGAGAIGMEFATAWHAYGVEVTIVELEDSLLPLEDADASKEIGRAFRKKGINALTGAKMSKVEATSRSVTCTVETSNGEEELKADVLLVAVGRAPVTDGAGIENLGVEIDERGFVSVDGYCRTNVDSVYALGDVIPTLMLAHASFQEGFLVADQLAGLDVVPIDYKGVPRVTYCHPEVSSVGLTEAEALEAVGEVVTEKYPFQALGRAQMMKASGMIKIIAEKDASKPGEAGRVLGIHIVGPRATDLISEAQLIYNWEALPIDVAHFIHAHPSLGEAIGEAHLALAGRALHG